MPFRGKLFECDVTVVGDVALVRLVNRAAHVVHVVVSGVNAKDAHIRVGGGEDFHGSYTVSGELVVRRETSPRSILYPTS